MRKKKYYLTGQKFGRLTVIERVPPPEHVSDKSSSYWRCSCDCEEGKEVVVRRGGLTSGRTRSCGCYKHDVNVARKKSNQYIVLGDTATVMDENGGTFLIDREDIEKISHLYWSVRKSLPNYVFAFVDGGKISLHRLVMSARPDDIVDHINHDTTDNRKCNLRVCTTQDNTRNKSIPRNNRSGIIGVCQEKSGDWRSYITINDSNYKLYSGKDREEAIRRRLFAENVYFGDFSPQKHLFKEYGIEVNTNNEARSVSDRIILDCKPEDPRLLFKTN